MGGSLARGPRLDPRRPNRRGGTGPVDPRRVRPVAGSRLNGNTSRTRVTGAHAPAATVGRPQYVVERCGPKICPSLAVAISEPPGRHRTHPSHPGLGFRDGTVDLASLDRVAS